MHCLWGQLGFVPAEVEREAGVFLLADRVDELVFLVRLDCQDILERSQGEAAVVHSRVKPGIIAHQRVKRLTLEGVVGRYEGGLLLCECRQLVLEVLDHQL